MIRLLRWGPRNGPQTPNARRASAKPRRASIRVARVEAPKWPPNPQRPSRLGEAAARLDHRRRCGSPEMTRPFDWGPRNGPQTPTLVAPRETRGAPRYRPRSSQPGNAWRASMSPPMLVTPWKRVANLDVPQRLARPDRKSVV